MTEASRNERTNANPRRRRVRHRPLWFDLALIVGGSASAGFGATLLFGVQASLSQPLATVLAGAGALSAGVLAYVNGQRSRGLTEAHHQADMDRERERHREDSRRAQELDLRNRYTTIATQIAHDSAAIRQAGVYALTALSDDWHQFGDDGERQVCIDLMQWYLRVPVPPVAVDANPDLPECEIRQTIVAILVERSRHAPEDPRSWAASNISLQHASLSKCRLRKCDLAEIDLSHADLSNTEMYEANLTRTNLTFACLDGANLGRADIADANLFRATLVSTNLHEAQLPRADLTRATLRTVLLSGANLAGAKLHRTALDGAELKNADLTGANLTAARLIGADLTGAKLIDANLIAAHLTDAKLDGILYNAATRWPEGFAPPPSR